MNEQITYFTDLERKRIIRITFLLILLIQCYWYASNMFFHQLCEPVFKLPSLDISYWIINLLNLPDLSTTVYVAYFLDICLFVLPLLCIVYPLKNYLSVLYFVLFFIYFIVFNTFSLFHCHVLIGVLFVIFPFMFKKNIAMSFMWEGLRYLVLFAFFSTFIWKLFRGSIFNEDQLMAVIQENLSPYLTYNQDTILAHLYYFFLQHNYLLVMFEILGVVIMEGIFIIGFFTKKYDKLLFINCLLLMIGFWFFADAVMFPLLLMGFPLLNFKTKKAA